MLVRQISSLRNLCWPQHPFLPEKWLLVVALKSAERCRNRTKSFWAARFDGAGLAECMFVLNECKGSTGPLDSTCSVYLLSAPSGSASQTTGLNTWHACFNGAPEEKSMIEGLVHSGEASGHRCSPT
jgi:hypothetical protein